MSAGLPPVEESTPKRKPTNLLSAVRKLGKALTNEDYSNETELVSLISKIADDLGESEIEPPSQ